MLFVPPTMLPVTLSAQLNGGKIQPRNVLVYQCRTLLRTTTNKWVVLICSIDLCSHTEFALGQRNGGGFSLHGGVNASIANTWNLFHTVQKQNVSMLEFQRNIAVTILASFGTNRPAKSLAFPRNVVNNVKKCQKSHACERHIKILSL